MDYSARPRWSARPELILVFLAFLLSIAATAISYRHGYIVAYGDAESHLNIAKRVIDSLTPGFAQLGGIWLPLPHLLMVPFVWSDFLWRSGLAGSIVSGLCYIVSALFIYKTILLISHRLDAPVPALAKAAAFAGSLVFLFNPNILYMQTTPMTELTLIVFFVLSSYYFIYFLKSRRLFHLLLAAFFGFLASLARYDGWSLVLMEAGLLFILYFPYRPRWSWPWLARKDASQPVRRAFEHLEGKIVLFCTVALFGIVLWLFWGYLILGDPLYFSHSQFSANSQQQSWLARGELPAYHHMGTAILYYLVTVEANMGGMPITPPSASPPAGWARATAAMELAATPLAIIVAIGVLWFVLGDSEYRLYITLILGVPFIFNVLTLYVGQSIIFIPSLTPPSWQWNLFNVRYGMMMVPFAAVFIGFLLTRLRFVGRTVVFAVFFASLAAFALGITPIITLADGTTGLSSEIARVPDAQGWLKANYDGGLVLTDDYARTISIIYSGIPLQNVIYVGNKPYWEQSLVQPELYARWIVIQNGDSLWQSLIEDPTVQARLYAYFNKVYTSSNILIFKRISTIPAPQASSAA